MPLEVKPVEAGYAPRTPANATRGSGPVALKLDVVRNLVLAWRNCNQGIDGDRAAFRTSGSMFGTSFIRVITYSASYAGALSCEVALLGVSASASLVGPFQSRSVHAQLPRTVTTASWSRSRLAESDPFAGMIDARLQWRHTISWSNPVSVNLQTLRTASLVRSARRSGPIRLELETPSLRRRVGAGILAHHWRKLCSAGGLTT